MARTFEKLDKEKWRVSVVGEFTQKELDGSYMGLFNAIQNKTNELRGNEMYIKNLRENIEKLKEELAELKPQITKKTIKSVEEAEQKIQEGLLKQKREGKL